MFCLNLYTLLCVHNISWRVVGYYFSNKRHAFIGYFIVFDVAILCDTKKNNAKQCIRVRGFRMLQNSLSRLLNRQHFRTLTSPAGRSHERYFNDKSEVTSTSLILLMHIIYFVARGSGRYNLEIGEVGVVRVPEKDTPNI